MFGLETIRNHLEDRQEIGKQGRWEYVKDIVESIFLARKLRKCFSPGRKDYFRLAGKLFWPD